MLLKDGVHRAPEREDQGSSRQAREKEGEFSSTPRITVSGAVNFNVEMSARSKGEKPYVQYVCTVLCGSLGSASGESLCAVYVAPVE